MIPIKLLRFGSMFVSLSMVAALCGCDGRPERPQLLTPAKSESTTTTDTSGATVTEGTAVTGGTNPGTTDSSSPAPNSNTTAPSNGGTTPTTYTGDTSTTTPVATGPVVDWAYVLEKVIQPNCLSCHSGNEPDADLDLAAGKRRVAAIFAIERTVLHRKRTGGFGRGRLERHDPFLSGKGWASLDLQPCRNISGLKLPWFRPDSFRSAWAAPARRRGLRSGEDEVGRRHRHQ